MRKELELIEKIEHYLKGTLSESEKMRFDVDLSYDSFLQGEVQLQKDVMGGIERKVLKKEIDNAYKRYQRIQQVQKMVLMGLGLLLLSSTAYFYSRDSKTTDDLVTTQKVVTQMPNNLIATTDSKSNDILTDNASGHVEGSAVKTQSVPLPFKKKDTQVEQGKQVIIDPVAEIKSDKKAEVAKTSEISVKIKNTSNESIDKQITKEFNTLDNNNVVAPGNPLAADAPKTDTQTKLFVPSAFSPNGDGVNDVFKIPVEGIVDLKCMIFTLEGEKVYEWSGIEGSWDGKTGIEKMQKNIFIYNIKVKYTGAQNFSSEQAGIVTIVK